MTTRELRAFERVAEAVIAPVAPLPHVRDTDAAAALQRSLAAVPRLNALALRALFVLAALWPWRWPLDRVGRGPLAAVAKAVNALAYLHYYGDVRVMRLLGYDPDAVVARAAEVRGR
jgi:hypothetical protein